MSFSEKMNEKRAALGGRTSDFSFIFHAFSRAYYTCMTRISQENGLSMGQPQVLLLLNMKDCRTQRELCDFLKIRPASMTDILQRMEKNDLVLRKRDEKDLRTMRVFITDPGREKINEFLKREAAMDEVFFHGFTEEEKKGFLSAFRRITENLMEENEEWRMKM